MWRIWKGREEDVKIVRAERRRGSISDDWGMVVIVGDEEELEVNGGSCRELHMVNSGVVR